MIYHASASLQPHSDMPLTWRISGVCPPTPDAETLSCRSSCVRFFACCPAALAGFSRCSSSHQSSLLFSASCFESKSCSRDCSLLQEREQVRAGVPLRGVLGVLAAGLEGGSELQAKEKGSNCCCCFCDWRGWGGNCGSFGREACCMCGSRWKGRA